MTEAVAVPAKSLPGGVEMPMIGFGTWQLRGRTGRQAVLTALQTGYRHIDTATMYGNEGEVGHALAESGLDRDSVFLTTKLPSGRADRERATLSASLRALGTDHVDLWLVHWPPAGRKLCHVWQEFLNLRDEGRVRAIGVSNYSLAQIDRLAEVTGEAPAVNQIHWNPRRYDAGLLEGLRLRGVVAEGYSPLKDTNLNDPVLTEIAWAHSVTPAQVVLRWHLDHEVAVIVKSADPKRMTANLNLFGFSLDADELAQIDGLAAR